MNSYELSRAFVDWSFDNPEKVKPVHYAIFFFAIEHCNRLGWKEKFGLPSQMVMEAIGVKNWRTYSKGLNDLVEFGFIEMVEVSRNQYSSNIIAIVKNTKATTKAQSKALDKALSKHLQKQGQKQGQSIVSIDKQLNNKTIEQYNKEQGTKKRTRFPALEELKLWGVDEQTAKDFLQNRKLKKLSNTATAFKNLLNEINKTNQMPSEIITICAERGWGSFKASWDWQEQSNTNGKKRGEGVNADYLQELHQRLNPKQ